MEIFILWAAFSVIVGVYASNKGRSGIGFFFLSIFCSPMIGGLCAAVSHPGRLIREKTAQREGLKKCSQCAEFVQGEAVVCRFCGHKFSPQVAKYGIVLEDEQ